MIGEVDEIVGFSDFGIVVGQERERAYFSLDQLEAIEGERMAFDHGLMVHASAMSRSPS